MVGNQFAKNTTEIFFGVLWSKRGQYRKGAHLMPPNSYVLIFDHGNPKQSQLMAKIAQLLRSKKKKVLYMEGRAVAGSCMSPK